MLSRMEEDNLKLVLTDMNLSRTVEEIAGSFQPVAEMQDKKFQLDIQPGLMFHGDENSIQQLVSTLVDNAMKYSNEGGIVGVTLSAARKGVKLEVYNTVFELDTKNLDKLFDRFYRRTLPAPERPAATASDCPSPSLLWRPIMERSEPKVMTGAP